MKISKKSKFKIAIGATLGIVVVTIATSLPIVLYQSNTSNTSNNSNHVVRILDSRPVKDKLEYEKHKFNNQRYKF